MQAVKLLLGVALAALIIQFECNKPPSYETSSTQSTASGKPFKSF
jgi:hypothetical protein